MNSSVAALYIVSLLCCAIHCTDGSSNSTKKIYILTLLPYPNPTLLFSPSFAEGLNVIPALDLAAQHVNRREGFLDGYELELIHRDGGCDVPTTTYAGLVSGLFPVFVINNPVVGLIGPGCSASTISSLSTINTQNRTSYIAVHGAGSPEINRATFPNSFGTLGSSYSYVDVIFAMMNESGWRNIAILVDPRRPFFRDTVQAFKRDLPNAFPDARILFSIIVYGFYIPLSEVRDSFARVVFVFTSVDLSQQIMCLALRFGMIYPDYQWIFVGHTFDDFIADAIVFNYNGEMYNCSTEEIANVALSGSFFLNYMLLPFEEDEPTVSGYSHREYLEQYNNSVMEYNSNLENSDEKIAVSIWATYFYDAVWAWAIVLDNVTKSSNFEEYQFDQPNDALIEQFEQIDFEGVSGRIKFDNETGSVDRFIDIFQVFDGNVEYVAYCNAGEIVRLTDDIRFIEDHFRETESDTKVNAWAAVAFVIPLVIQMLIIIFTEVITVIKQDYKSIKASSPKLNHLAYCGCYLLIIGFLLYTIEETVILEIGSNGHVCQAIWAFFIPFGCTLAFGTAAVRTWRLYRIFNHYLKPGRFISNKALFVIVFSILAVDVIIAIVWTTTDPLVVVLTMQTRTTSDGLGNLLYIERNCRSQYHFYWLGVVFSYRFIELGAVLVLALLTSNIRNKSFETKTLQGLVYGMAITFGLGAVLYFFVIFQPSLHDNYSYVILGAIINLMLLLYLCCIFAPPIIPLLKEKLKVIVVSGQ